jgi:AcrR family transcriptional regulator
MSKGPTERPPARPPKRELVRGEPVVQRVLAATMEELARVGYRALRVEDVAARAGVNKTTVYRRWPEKVELVRAALGSVAERKMVAPETGSLRGDLLAIGRNMAQLFSSPQGQSVFRMLVAEGSDAEVKDLRRALRRDRKPIPLAVMAAAVARGELSADTPEADQRLLFQAFMGAIHHRLFFMNEPATPAFLERLVDLLLLGALTEGARAEPRSRAR